MKKMSHVSKFKPLAKVEYFTHAIRLTHFSGQVRNALRVFIKKHLLAKELTKERGRWVVRPGKCYGFVSSDKNEFVTHINTEKDLFQYLYSAGITKDKMEIIKHDISNYDAALANIKVIESIVPYDYQDEIIADLTDGNGHRKSLSLSMGLGKGVCAMKSAELIGKRTALLILPKYLEKWIEEICASVEGIGTTNKKDKTNRYYVVKNCDDLIAILDECSIDKDYLNGYDILIIQITTLRVYIERFYNYPKYAQDTMVHPRDIWKVLRVGFRFTDEVHEHFHLNYMIDLHTHMPYTLYLSATMEPTHNFMKEVYKYMFPLNERLGLNLIKKYTNVEAVFYRHQNPERWRCSAQGMYNHSVYEANFVVGKIAPLLRITYFNMIYNLIEKDYLEVRKDGQKAIIFFSRVDMCTMFSDWLSKQLPDIDVRRYVAEDDYDDVINAEIVVTTPGSAGTGLDIKGLILNIMTISVQSVQLNRQIFGRTRELKKWPGQYPKFIYLVGEDLEKPYLYHKEKVALLKPLALSQTTNLTTVVLPK